MIESFNVKLNQKEIQLNEKEEQINCLQNKLTTTQLTANNSSEDNLPQNEYKMVEYLTPGNQYHSEVKKDLSSSCKTVLESVINCLQV